MEKMINYAAEMSVERPAAHTKSVGDKRRLILPSSCPAPEPMMEIPRVVDKGEIRSKPHGIRFTSRRLAGGVANQNPACTGPGPWV